MRLKSYPILVLFSISIFALKAQDDTLRLYNKLLPPGTIVNSTTFIEQIARFDLERGATIKGFVFHLDGNTGGMDIRLFGHEGGTAFPQFENDLMPKRTIVKMNTGIEKVVLTLPNPIRMANNQFFVQMENISPGMGVVQSLSNYQPSCTSSNGGNYYPTYLNHTSTGLSANGKLFWIDVILQYDSVEPQKFYDVTAAMQIDTNLSNRSIAWGDIDNNGWLEMLVGGKLYIFNQTGQFIDATVAAGIGDTSHSYVGNAFIDMDNDGLLDIIIFGRPHSMLYLNNGDNSFAKQQLSIPDLPSLHCYSMADLNNDGYLDLFIGQLWGTYPEPKANYLLYNNTSNDFTDETTRLYPQHVGDENYPSKTLCVAGSTATYLPNQNRNKRSRGSQFTDFDNDGDLDLYVTNYFLEEDELYENDGTGNFILITAAKNIDQNNSGNNHGTGVDWYDYDNDGDFDLLLSQFAHPNFVSQFDHRGTTIYRNNGGSFTDLNGSHGIEFEETHGGAAWGDVNNDGLADFTITAYYGCRYIDLYLQKPDNTFEVASSKYGLNKIVTSADACWVDFNNDGLLDLVTGKNYKIRLFENRDYDNGNNYLKINLKSVNGNSLSVGSKVKVLANDGKIYTQEINAGRGQLMQKPSILHFGLGKAKAINGVDVVWANGSTETFTGLNINNQYTLTEGGRAVLSLDEVSENNYFVVYPNPSKGKVSIQFTGAPNKVNIEIYNSAGARVYKKKSNSKQTVTINNKSLSNGLYRVVVFNDLGFVGSKSFVVNR